MLRADTTKGKEEAPTSDSPVANKTDKKVLRFLERARGIKGEIDEINVALDQEYIDNLDQLQVGIETLSAATLELNDAVSAIKAHTLLTAQQQLVDVKELTQTIAQSIITT